MDDWLSLGIDVLDVSLESKKGAEYDSPEKCGRLRNPNIFVQVDSDVTNSPGRADPRTFSVPKRHPSKQIVLIEIVYLFATFPVVKS